jgi:hypothetical protein
MHSKAFEQGCADYYAKACVPPVWYDEDMRRDWQAGYDEAAFEDAL